MQEKRVDRGGEAAKISSFYHGGAAHISTNTAAGILAFFLMACVSAAVWWRQLDAVETIGSVRSAFVEERVERNLPNARISLPVFYGLGQEKDAAVNQHIAQTVGLDDILSFVDAKQAAGETDWDARLRYRAFAAGSVLRISISSFRYETGSRGEEARHEIYVDGISGQVYEMADLFVPGQYKAAQEAIAALIRRQIDRNPDDFFAEPAVLPLPDNFRITNTGLTLLYAPETVAPYGEGFAAFEIPMEQIERYVDKKGAFYKSLTVKTLDETAGYAL